METTQTGYKIITKKGRDISQSIMNLILAKWMRSLKRGNDYFKLADSDSYYAAYELYIKSILNYFNTEIELAVLSDDEDVVLGFCVHQGPILHYVFVQKDLRSQGIARSLINFPVEIITHLTKIGLSIWNNKLPNAKFNPFAQG